MNNHQNFNTVGEQGYLDLLQHILNNGYKSNRERTGTGTLVSPTPHQLHFPKVREQYPLFTTKKVSFNMLACEMLWFISGSTNTNDLKEIGSPAMKKMWDKWAEDDGELGPVYGKQWREWRARTENRPERVSIDQLDTVIRNIKNNPESRRHIVSAWNPADLDDMALPPCHLMYQFTCELLSDRDREDIRLNMDLDHGDSRTWDELNIPKYRLHLHLTQRSCDMFLGVPFNIAQYALLLLMVSKVTNTIPGDFTWTGVNCHIYQNHVEAVEEQISREPKGEPMLMLEKDSYDSIDDFSINDFSLHGYNPYNKIEAEVSV